MSRPPRFPTPQRVVDRLYLNASPSANGCLVSGYSTGSHGYAQIGWNEPGYKGSQMLLAHRAIWQHVHGAIPEGMTVDHICHERRCINVDHMRLLTNYENARRTAGRDWPVGECVNGHSNDLLRQFGKRTHCSICHDEWIRRYKRRSA